MHWPSGLLYCTGSAFSGIGSASLKYCPCCLDTDRAESVVSPAKRFGGDVVLALSVRPKPFRPSCFSVRTHLGIGFSDFIVVLQEYELAYEDGSHQV